MPHWKQRQVEATGVAADGFMSGHLVSNQGPSDAAAAAVGTSGAPGSGTPAAPPLRRPRRRREGDLGGAWLPERPACRRRHLRHWRWTTRAPHNHRRNMARRQKSWKRGSRCSGAARPHRTRAHLVQQAALSAPQRGLPHCQSTIKSPTGRVAARCSARAARKASSRPSFTSWAGRNC